MRVRIPHQEQTLKTNKMSIDINKKQVRVLIPVIEARIQVLRKRVLKENINDWYDYPDNMLDQKVSEKNEEFRLLNGVLDKLHLYGIN